MTRVGVNIDVCGDDNIVAVILNPNKDSVFLYIAITQKGRILYFTLD